MKRKYLFRLSCLLLITGLAPAAKADEPLPNPVHTWNELALHTVRTGRLSDAQAARLYAMINVAMYDAVNGIESRRIESRRGRVKRNPALVDPVGAPIYGNRYAAASAAAYTVLAQEHPALAATYDAQLEADLAAIEDGPPRTKGIDWGVSVGDQGVALRQNDGSTPNEAQPGSTGPGEFRASWSGVQFRNLVPFAIADPSLPTVGRRPKVRAACRVEFPGAADGLLNMRLGGVRAGRGGQGPPIPLARPAATRNSISWAWV